ncbi:hypothetical protein CcCBS67573_g05022 [Chytriomyces confervae]|uniref:F-box domain-containing protein n=1 Tax=Chytriomyces confervae TaxID=246404 RepID=A0A507FD93_9FUNG|nr:hypothetical protein CcCBS67573_g05022 [Chytriomyces confervae]
MPPGEAGTAMILRALENIQATMCAMKKEVSDMKEAQRYLSNQVLGLQNRNKKFFTRLRDVPLEIIAQIFAWIPVRTVLHFRRLSKTIYQCLMTTQFAVLNMQTADFLKGLEDRVDRTWFHLPEPYQTVYANAMSGQLKIVTSKIGYTETKALPESITRLTAVEEIQLACGKLTGSIPDGIGALQNLTNLDLRLNKLTGPLPSSLNVLVALQTLYLTGNQLCGEFPALPNLHALQSLFIDGNRFTGPIPTVFGSPHTLLDLSVSCNRFSAIPATIGHLSNLVELTMCDNPFAHEIPSAIWTLTELTLLEMKNCKLSGSFAGIGNLQQLECLDACNNQFSGELPFREIQSMENLVHLHLIGNQMSGGEMLDMTGTKLYTMCVDPDIQMNHVVGEKEYYCTSRHTAEDT